MKLWMNGTIMEPSEAVIPVSDHGFLYGMGLFETLRTYKGEPFLLEHHAERLSMGCKELRIGFRPDAARLRGVIQELLAANAGEIGSGDAYLRLSVSAGESPLGLPDPEGYRRPNVVLMMKPLAPPVFPPQPKPLALLRIRRSSPEGRIRHKSFHYMNNIVGKWELADRELPAGTEGLFLNESGFVTEGIVSNVFSVRDGKLATPAASTGLLPGITRRFVCELAEKLGITVAEGHYTWKELVAADELFVTNSVQEIVPIDRLFDGEDRTVRLWQAEEGSVTAKLAGEYRSAADDGKGAHKYE